MVTLVHQDKQDNFPPVKECAKCLSLTVNIMHEKSQRYCKFLVKMSLYSDSKKEKKNCYITIRLCDSAFNNPQKYVGHSKVISVVSSKPTTFCFPNIFRKQTNCISGVAFHFYSCYINSTNTFPVNS